MKNEWRCNIDKGMVSGVFFPDLKKKKKAFDAVDHKILLKKLRLVQFLFSKQETRMQQT